MEQLSLKRLEYGYVKVPPGKHERLWSEIADGQNEQLSKLSGKFAVLQIMSYRRWKGHLARKISVSFSQKSSSFEPQKIAGQMRSTAMSRFVKGTAGFGPGFTVQ